MIGNPFSSDPPPSGFSSTVPGALVLILAVLCAGLWGMR